MINKAQIGFETQNRTSDHLLTVKSLVNKYVNDNKGKLYEINLFTRKNCLQETCPIGKQTITYT